ncbi:MAG: MarR family transcriptional regulator [Candidatus Latescibacteria bacterium]|nr:MarR family transcriptional regulator [Candidatus Latescibacterota bacterium]
MGSHYPGTECEVRALNAFIKLFRAAESLNARISQKVAAHHLTLSQFGVLETLCHLGPLPQCKLGEKLLKSSGNITMVVDNLEKLALVERRRDRVDRRVVTVHLTAEGRALIERIFPEHVAAIVEEMGVLDGGEQEQLGQLCRKVGLRRG